MADSPTGRIVPRRLLPGISIEYKLHLFLSVLLLSVIVVSSWAASRGVRQAGFAKGAELVGGR